MKKTLFLSIFIVILSINAFADIRLPDNIKTSPTATPKSDKKTKRMQMSIRVNPNVDEATLVIPRSALKDLRAQLDEPDGGSSNVAAISGVSGTQTLMSGLFFSAALIFGGVWMFRGKTLGKNQKIVAGFLIFAFLGASVATVFANVAPPPIQGLKADLFGDKMRSSIRGATGTVKVEIDNDAYQGATIQLIIPRNNENSRNDEE